MSANNYLDRVRRLVRTVTQDDLGQELETFNPGSYYWCRIEENVGRRNPNYGANQTGADALIYVRNMPTLSALDRFEDADGQVWVIDHIVKDRAEDQLVCDCYRFDELQLDDDQGD